MEKTEGGIGCVGRYIFSSLDAMPAWGLKSGERGLGEHADDFSSRLFNADSNRSAAWLAS